MTESNKEAERTIKEAEQTALDRLPPELRERIRIQGQARKPHQPRQPPRPEAPPQPTG